MALLRKVLRPPLRQADAVAVSPTVVHDEAVTLGTNLKKAGIGLGRLACGVGQKRQTELLSADRGGLPRGIGEHELRGAIRFRVALAYLHLRDQAHAAQVIEFIANRPALDAAGDIRA